MHCLYFSPWRTKLKGVTWDAPPPLCSFLPFPILFISEIYSFFLEISRFVDPDVLIGPGFQHGKFWRKESTVRNKQVCDPDVCDHLFVTILRMDLCDKEHFLYPLFAPLFFQIMGVRLVCPPPPYRRTGPVSKNNIIICLTKYVEISKTRE